MSIPSQGVPFGPPKRSASGRDRALPALRWAAGAIFVVFGLGKFVDHAGETAAFSGYGLPAAGALVVAVGALEVVGGALLLGGREIRPTAAALAVNMTGAVVLAGVVHGELLSLTLAPALLVAMVVLVLRAPLSPGAARP